jgi:hypothetical protein
MQAVVAAFRAPPVSALRDEVEGLYAHECKAVLRNLKHATTYLRDMERPQYME